MKLDQAKNYASKIYEWLLPHVQPVSTVPTMMVVGSIRRARPEVNDVDIVCLPRLTEERDMFGEVVGRRNHVHHHLTLHAQEGRARILSGAAEGKRSLPTK